MHSRQRLLARLSAAFGWRPSMIWRTVRHAQASGSGAAACERRSAESTSATVAAGTASGSAASAASANAASSSRLSHCTPPARVPAGTSGPTSTGWMRVVVAKEQRSQALRCQRRAAAAAAAAAPSESSPPAPARCSASAAAATHSSTARTAPRRAATR